MRFAWSENLNKWYRNYRKISFQEIIYLIGNNQIIGVLVHPTREKYKKTLLILVRNNKKIYIIPAKFKKSENICYLISIFRYKNYK